MAKKRFYSENSGGMLNNDESAPANIPQKAFMRTYPSTAFMNDNLDDTIRGVDEQMNADVAGMRREKAKTRF